MRHSIFKRLCFTSLLLLSSIVMANPKHGAAVLMYHHFGETRYPSTNITLQQFDQHLDYLEQQGFQVWPLEKIVNQLKTGKPFPAQVVAITIDDAYRSIYTHAYPRLKKRNWPFTVFVSTDVIDKKMPAFMSWDQMREMQQHGATFANHSSYHDSLIEQKEKESFEAWRQRIFSDLTAAQKRLRTELGVAPPLFAYPYGEYNTALQQIIKNLGWIAVGQQSGVMSQYADPLALPRYPMAERFAALKPFKTKVASLPLPVINASPADPMLGQQNPPHLHITLEKSDDIQLDQLNCFASNQGNAKITWTDKERGQFTVEAHKSFKSRRSRYNCTAPSKSTGRYYWYSHLWIQP